MGKNIYAIGRLLKMYDDEYGMSTLPAFLLGLLIFVVISAVLGAIVGGLIYLIAFDGGSNMDPALKKDKFMNCFLISTVVVFIILLLCTCV